MLCNVCNTSMSNHFFQMSPATIWTGNPSSDTIADVVLYQCKVCGHIQEPIDNGLEEKLDAIYRSSQAQLSTELGISNWGSSRKRYILKELSYLEKQFNKVLEIGCGSGDLLYYFKEKGAELVYGIEPSLESSEVVDGVHFFNEYASDALQFETDFDFIYSIMAFEHIAEINGVMQFIHRHLTEDGICFFEIPNGERLLHVGDPGLFSHEHVNIFTRQSIERLVEENGFIIDRVVEIRDSLFVFMKKSWELHMDRKGTYQQKINNMMKNTIHLFQQKVAFHGVNNALNNILNWSKVEKDFLLFDNDDTKIGSSFFDMTVYAPDAERLQGVQTVIVVAHWYYDEIVKQYRNLGFQGKIVNILSLSSME